ncbi:hypothetical protein GXM_00417 [Nostoc sphaeroides CCNUC1]|uniref:Uncharacterized protein n=1 Tax=Nostoc sphaeroides CCNUC1 TaxID=2653204 RepID=A0A5P8VRN0_9NOSO|nr:hypothetical protein GXM_00417 [Nostoc sphaeroides CCNUC1]
MGKDHWCQLNVKPLSRRDIQFSRLVYSLRYPTLTLPL